jgi:hypothetical protein
MAVRKQVLGEGAFPTCGWETAVKERGSMARRDGTYLEQVLGISGNRHGCWRFGSVGRGFVAVAEPEAETRIQHEEMMKLAECLKGVNHVRMENRRFRCWELRER